MTYTFHAVKQHSEHSTTTLSTYFLVVITRLVCDNVYKEIFEQQLESEIKIKLKGVDTSVI